MANYFTNFPSVEYDKFGLVRDITARASVIINDSTPLLPYDQQPSVRADILADKYYDDPSKDWMIYLANKVVDPLIDAYMSDHLLDAYIEDQYGSTQIATTKIKHWINDWRSDDSQIAPALYDNLPTTAKQLYDPIIDYRDNIIGYQRKQEDLTRPTSLYLDCTIEENDLVEGDLIEFIDGVSVGSGEVKQVIDSTNIILHHIQYVYDVSSIRKKNTTTEYSITINQEIPCIGTDVAAYFTPESYYEYEVRQNEQRRAIQLIDKRFSDDAQDQLRTALR